MPFDPDAYPDAVPQDAQIHQHQQQQRIDAAYQAMNAKNAEMAEEVQEEMDLMTEARVRFAKAALYEQIINGQLFEGDDAVTLAVEDEFKTFAEERLRILLGIDSESQGPKGVKFDADEMTILKGWAAKLLGRPASIPRPEMPAARLAAPKPGNAPVAPPQAQLAPPKRGRGRPPGTSKHQRAAAAVAQAQRPVSLPQTNPAGQPGPVAPVIAPPADPQLQGLMRQVVLPNGQVRNVSIQRGPGGQVMDSQPSPDRSGPKPMPSPDEMIAQAAAIGDAGLRAFTQQTNSGGTAVPITPTY